MRAYGEIIHSLHDETMWEEVPGEPVQPPPLKRLSGRPRKCRRAAVEPALGVASLEDHAQSDVLIAKRLATTKELAKELLLEALEGVMEAQ